MNFFNQTTSLAASLIVMYIAFIVNFVVAVFLEIFQDTVHPFKVNTSPMLYVLNP